MKLAVTSHPVGVPEKSRDPQQKAAFFEVSPEDCPTWLGQAAEILGAQLIIQEEIDKLG